MRSLFVANMNYFVKSLKNIIGLTSTKKSIICLWYQRCWALNIYPNGPMLKEEAMAIKESLQNSSLDQFCASEGWLDIWKSAYAIKERRIVGEA